MKKDDLYVANAEEWDSGALGRDESHVKKADASFEKNLDEALGLQMISIRLHKKLLEELKFIAVAHGVGYQPLIKDVLSRFAKSEIQEIIRCTIERKKIEEQKLQKEASKPTRQRKVA